ncbi:hypothetical protein [Bowmanella denitrificans]|uniref:hypothetical protein n=1 Tax=Bowmanella denitrificans TaxID=366582 RepID=UPI000C9B63F5|nr:hypothetical protein [Bowmanella denitrificans]
MSRHNQQFYDMGRKARFTAELTAWQSQRATQMPLSSHNATAHSYWRQGWNSVSLAEIQQYINANQTGHTPSSVSSPPQQSRLAALQAARQRLKEPT